MIASFLTNDISTVTERVGHVHNCGSDFWNLIKTRYGQMSERRNTGSTVFL